MFGPLNRTPRRAAGIPNVACGATTRRSHATASCMPAPSAAPFTAAITGAGNATMTLEQRLERRPEGVAAAMLEATNIGAAPATEVSASAERLVARAADDDGTEVLGSPQGARAGRRTARRSAHSGAPGRSMIATPTVPTTLPPDGHVKTRR